MLLLFSCQVVVYRTVKCSHELQHELLVWFVCGNTTRPISHIDSAIFKPKLSINGMGPNGLCSCVSPFGYVFTAENQTCYIFVPSTTRLCQHVPEGDGDVTIKIPRVRTVWANRRGWLREGGHVCQSPRVNQQTSIRRRSFLTN